MQLAIEFLPYQRHSATSREAAIKAKPCATENHATLLSFLRVRPQGATDEEMQIHTGMCQNTQRPRRIELMNAGLVVDSGIKGTTTSGRKAVIWAAV